MSEEWDLGPAAELPEGAPCLKKGPGGERLACIRRSHDGEAIGVDVLADGCPHEGYPLSQGTLRDGVLTCKWHNWKFETSTGECTFGGESARRFPARIDERGHVMVDGRVDPVDERARLEKSFVRRLPDAAVDACTRDALRLAALAGERGMAAPFELLLGDGVSREEYGFDHPEASAIDLWTWVARGWLPPEEAIPAAITVLAEPLQHRSLRPCAEKIETEWEGAKAIADALANERREEAEGRARHLAAIDAEKAIALGLLPFVRRALYDYGHGAIFVAKGLEVVRAFPALGEATVAALTSMLAWATSETALPTWSATREAVARSQMIDRVGTTPIDAQARATYETAVLAGEREAVTATLELVARGFDVASVLRAIGHAAAVRMRRFDLRWARRMDARIGFLDVTHAVTCARAMQELWSLSPIAENVSLAVIAASFVGKLRKADDPDFRPPDPFVGDARASRVVDAVRAREPARARAIAARIDRATRLEAFRGLAPFAAFDAAVRPIFLAHTIKTTEALYRMEIDDLREGSAYLDALVRYLGTPLPERSFFRTAAIAKQFLADGKPPDGLY